MNKFVRFYFFLFLPFITYSCMDEEAEVKTPDFIQKFVVQCSISPDDSIIRAYVDYNSTAYGIKYKDNIANNNVELIISDGLTSKKFAQKDKLFSLDTSEFKIFSGNKYYLKINDNKGNQASSECIIPVKHDFVFKWDTITEVLYNKYDDYYFTYLSVILSFNDIPDEQNYYCISIKEIFSDPIDNYHIPYTSMDHHWYFSDKDRDGKEIKFRTQTEKYNSDYYNSIELDLLFFQIDKVYYDFIKSCQNYTDPEDSPFSEPSPLYTNINGGLGYFCGYTQKSISIRIK